MRIFFSEGHVSIIKTEIWSASLDEELFFVLLLSYDINIFQPPAFESEVAQRLSTPGVAVGECWIFVYLLRSSVSSKYS